MDASKIKDSVEKKIHKLAKLRNLTYVGFGKNIGTHVLRKFKFNDCGHIIEYQHSQLISEGWDLVAVSKRLGHSDTTTTLRYYAHLVPNNDSSRVESFKNSILGTNF